MVSAFIKIAAILSACYFNFTKCGEVERYSYAVSNPTILPEYEPLPNFPIRVYRAMDYDNILKYKDLKNVGGTDVFQIFKDSVSRHPTRPFLTVINDDKMEHLPYREVSQLVDYTILALNDYYFEDALVNINCDEPENFLTCKVQSKYRFMGILAGISVNWMLLLLASIYDGFTLVPLHKSFSPEYIKHCLEETKMKVLAGECSLITNAISAGVFENSSVESLLIMNQCTKSETEILENEKNLKIRSMDAIVNKYKAAKNSRIPARCRSDVQFIVYTSGSTGKPKGVIITEANVMVVVQNTNELGGMPLDHRDSYLGFLPPQHIMGLMNLFFIINHGMNLGIPSGNPKKIIDEIKIFRPTILISVPRLLNLMNIGIQGKANDPGVNKQLTTSFRLRRYIFNAGLRNMVNKFNRTGKTNSFLYKTILKLPQKIKRAIDPNLRVIVCGGGQTAKDIIINLQVLLDVPVIEGWGMSETTSVATIANVHDPIKGHIGGPLPCSELAIVPVDGWTDANPMLSQDGNAGELLIRGDQVMPGYFKKTTITNETIDKLGFMHTGDIVTRLPSGAFKIIDRVKNCVKLQQGVYISLEKIEAIAMKSPEVQFVMTVADDSVQYPGMLVYPNIERLPLYCRANGIKECTVDNLAINKKYRQFLLENIQSYMENDPNLLGFEKIKDIEIIVTPFSTENKTLTPTLKPSRPFIKNEYTAEITKLMDRLQRYGMFDGPIQNKNLR